jgi:hypothetical protein
MRKNVVVDASAADRARLVCADCPKSKTCVWRLQERLLQEGVAGLLRFLNAIEAEARVGRIVHVIPDNLPPHKHPKTQAWLHRKLRFASLSPSRADSG